MEKLIEHLKAKQPKAITYRAALELAHAEGKAVDGAEFFGALWNLGYSYVGGSADAFFREDTIPEQIPT